jgi:hypothetical protein
MLNKKVKGGALYIALIISIVIGITLSIFILIGFHTQKQVISQINLQQLKNNLNSAFTIAQSEYFLENENNQWLAIGPESDSIRIKRIQWGAYTLISTESKNAHQYLKQCGLYGESNSTDTAILICDHKEQISLAGKIKFNGNCYFPKAEYKPTVIEGRNFNPISSFRNFLRPAPRSLPIIRNGFIAGVKKSLLELNPGTDSLVDVLANVLNNNFSARTIVVQEENINLSSYQLTGNIKLVGTKTVLINKTNILNNVLVIAPVVRIRKGFTGTLNIIASDSIIVEENCLLNYPSSLIVLKKSIHDNNSKVISIGTNSKIYGSLICLKETDEQTLIKEMIKLNSGSEIYGLIYSSGYAQLQGKIYGSAYCDKLIFKSSTTIYENHMIDCEIDPKKYGLSMVVPGIFRNRLSNKCCKWL